MNDLLTLVELGYDVLSCRCNVELLRAAKDGAIKRNEVVPLRRLVDEWKRKKYIELLEEHQCVQTAFQMLDALLYRKRDFLIP